VLLPEVEVGKRRATLTEDVLGALAVHEVNIHLVLVVVDLVVGKLFPEMLAP
jgi:hypothetical protein